MEIFVDTNIILDVLCLRSNYEGSLFVMNLCESKMIKGYISALTLPNINYILRKLFSKEERENILKKLLLIFKVVDLREKDLLSSLKIGFNDFEDSIQYVSAKRKKVDFIISRNKKHFMDSKIPVIEPEDFIKFLKRK